MQFSSSLVPATLNPLPWLRRSRLARRVAGAWAVLASLTLAHAAFGQASIELDLSKPGHRISPTLWGIFFEDINNSADGGIYPELVRNRSFEDAAKPQYWSFANLAGRSGAVRIEDAQPLNPFNRHYLRVQVDGAFSLENRGYWGMNVLEGESYLFKVAVRVEEGFQGPLAVKILSSTGRELAAGALSGFGSTWKYHTLQLTATGSDAKAKLQLSAGGSGVLCLDMVSLLPARTWKHHGLRPDLAESLEALHPSFMRFPGGCWVEGDDRAHMYRWKNTIGESDVRIPLWNIWGYNATHGLGFHEYLQLAEDLGAAPLFDINVGMSHHEIVPLEEMDSWVQDALDAIEYANGPTNSTWGARRAAAGHPAPFHLRFMEIGNENGGEAYRQRWPLFVKAIKEKYPEMQLVANHWQGSYPKTPRPDLVDEHYYESPEAFMRRATQYDTYDRKGPKVFVGEYAVTQRAGQGNLRAAIGEAAFMTGLERNSDLVLMACYAPLFVNLNHRAWNPDLINFDSSSWYGLPGYYVQQMFSQNRGDVTVPVRVQAPLAQPEVPKGMVGVGTWNTEAEFKDLKVTAPDGKLLYAADFTSGTDGWELLGGGDWKAQDGVLRQSAQKEFVRAIAGSRNWTDYTLTLKARKLAGQEGFLVLFHINDKEDRTWWNIGGWRNTQDGVEHGGTIDPKPSHIDTGRWYDLRLQVSDKRVKCYLDGQLIHDVDYQSEAPVSSLYASASKEERSGDLLLKVVNTEAHPLQTRVNLLGAAGLSGQGTVTVLTAASANDENSLAEPKKVSPRTEPLTCSGTTLDWTFPANSVNVLRLKAAR